MKKIAVFYEGWGERWQLATIAEDGRTLLFEYSAEAQAEGLELSPRHLKLRAAAYGDFPSYLLGLPGLISDGLPDGWGMQLMDRLFRMNNIDPVKVSVLDRLAFIGRHGIGALTFQPASEMAHDCENVQLLNLAQQVSLLIAGKDSVMLKELALL